jgi:hypothetical protein
MIGFGDGDEKTSDFEASSWRSKRGHLASRDIVWAPDFFFLKGTPQHSITITCWKNPQQQRLLQTLGIGQAKSQSGQLP